MQRRIPRSIFAFILALVFIGSLFLALLPSPASAAATQAEIDELKRQKSALSDQVNEYQSQINALKSQKSDQVELKTALDNKLALTNQQILNLTEQIKLHDKLIEQKTEEVKQAQKSADEQLARYRTRIRAMEESGRYNYLEVLFGANSIAEFLGLIDDIGDIMKSDKALEESYRQSISELKDAKAEYEAAQAEMKNSKAELKTLQEQLEADIDEAAAVISELQKDISANSGRLSELSKQEDELKSQIDAKVRELNEQRRREEEERKKNNPEQPSTPGSNTGTGNFIWPSYCTYISSRQGPRIHPVTGEYKNHGGTDIGASYGTAIWAADSGRVVASSDGWNGGWGNYVMIDHGNGYQTLYAHMSSRAVSVGQIVSRGQTIGYVGNTGLSTGPHLHFEMYENDGRIDPQTKFPGMSFTYAADA